MLKVGKIVATHGLQGAIVLKQIIDGKDWLKKGDVLFVEMVRNSFIPFFVETAKSANNEEYIITLDDVTAPDEARKLVNKTAYVKEEVLELAKVDSPLLYIGFNLVDQEKGGLGVIEDVMLIGPQWIAKMTIENKEVLIPLAEDWILDVNMRNKFIRMNLPAGLIDMYLGN